MDSRKFYRADKRDFAIDDPVASAGEFITKTPSGSQIVERVFEEERPAGYPLRTQLYVFENIADAKKHWSKMKGGKLYEVAVEENGILHRGDMALVDEAYVNRDALESVRDCARRYWRGELTDKPVIEILVECARVCAVVSKDERERVAFFESWAIVRGKLPGPSDI